MKRKTLFNLLAALGFALILTITVLMSYQTQAQEPAPALPIMFVENAGQFDPQVRFQAQGPQGALDLTEDGIRYTLVQRSSDEEAPQVIDLKVTFVGANPHSRITGLNRLETRVSYFTGADPAGWRANLPAWRGVRYKELYPGIDLELGSENGHLVQRLVVRPGADLGAVRLRVEGAESLVVEGGRLRATTRLGEITLPLLVVTDQRPAGQPAVHHADHGTFEVTWPFTSASGIHNALVTASTQVTGTYTLDYSTFLGGTTGVSVLTDEGYAIAVDSAGAVYVTGWTYCNDFFTSGAYDIIYNGAQDVFVAKLSADGSTLEYATYLGGDSNEEGHGIAVDSAGNAYITGWTLSYPSNPFPTTDGAFDTTYNGGNYDAFVTKLNPTGSGLVYSTFLGGSGDDKGHGIAVDSAGHAYITGEMDSTDFPTTTNAYDTSSYYGDAFVVKVNAAGSDLDYATYLGGSGYDYGYGITVSYLGDAYVTGHTGSSDFPTTPLSFDTIQNGGWDAFVTVLHPAGGGASDLVYSTYLGGDQADYGTGIAVRPGGAYTDAYVTGYTDSSNFPTTTVAFDNTHNGLEDGFVVKLNPAGGGQNDLIYSTFLGGETHDWANGIAVDGWGAAYVVGTTESYYFPTTPDAYQSTRNGLISNEDAFMTKLSADGSTLAYSTFLGTVNSALHDYGRGIAIDSSGNAYVTGYTDGADFPTTAGAYDTTHNGDWDVFVTKFRWLDQSIYLPLTLRGK